MQRIPPELLLRVLASLPSKQMVLFRRVNADWEKLMGETTTLWKSLVIRREEGIEWNPSILDLFLLKSQGTMEEICLRLTIPATEILNIVEKLQITKNTLRSLSLVLIRPDSEHGRKLIEFITLNCPNLVSLKVLYAHWIPSQLTVEHDRLEVELSSRTNRKSLWVHYLPQSLLEKDSKFLQNLTTLSLERVENQGELRKILQVTKAHLRSLHFRTSEKGDEHLEDLILEGLSRVEVAPPFSSIPNEFPSWLKCPNLSLLVLDGIGECASIESFPQSIKELWCLPDRWTLPSDEIVKGILNSFGSSIPNLERLKLTQGFPFHWDDLLNVLKSRKEAEDLQSIKGLIVELDGSCPEEEVRRYVDSISDVRDLTEFALY